MCELKRKMRKGKRREDWRFCQRIRKCKEVVKMRKNGKNMNINMVI